MTGQTCALPGCGKPRWPSVRKGDSPPLACGNLHHQLLMAGRFNPALPHPYQGIRDRNDAELCALLSCKESPFVGHSWCSRTHYLLWLTEFTSSLQPDQICMLPGCTRHVFVDDNAPPSRFCGWRHEQKSVMLSALQRHPVPSVGVPPQQPPLPASFNESECDHLPSLNCLILSLKEFARSAIAPKNIRVIEDFFEKHPCEIFSEGHSCWLIARLKFTSKGRKRKLITKGHYHWKQSSRPCDKKSKYTGKYYTYTKMAGKEKEADQHHADESSYSMKEYTMEDVKWYSLIHLVKKNPSSDGKHGKEQPKKPQIADQVDSFDIGTWDDYMSVDSIFSDLDFTVF